METVIPNRKKESAELREAADKVAGRRDADVIRYNGLIGWPGDRQLLQACMRRKLRKNVMLILETFGGSPDVAYRLTRFLQSKYSKLSLFVVGFCKSAGTLVATGAHELIFSDRGELGPLDTQMQKKDDLGQTQSSLIKAHYVLSALGDNAQAAFTAHFGGLLETKDYIGGSVTFQTASEIASKYATNLYAPLYRQVDPHQVAEALRMQAIAQEYGRRLLQVGRNLSENKLGTITSGYPSHEFVIDRKEASQLFENVREPDGNENILATLLYKNGAGGEFGVAGGHPQVDFLSSEKDDSEAQAAP